ncbi:hypothetical protein AGR1A_Lc40153 [Agrobacterium fabacearum CFBP 5771]|nr:hypothetical protein AGR1A_Lc40153 [Agrobacterium fabacearum CFBP 5771]
MPATTLLTKICRNLSQNKISPAWRGPGSKPDIMSGTLTGASTHPLKSGVDLSHLTRFGLFSYGY